MLDGDPHVLRDVAKTTNFVTTIAITGFVRTIATWQLVMEGVWVVSQQNADIADTLQLETSLWQPFLSFYM